MFDPNYLRTVLSRTPSRMAGILWLALAASPILAQTPVLPQSISVPSSSNPRDSRAAEDAYLAGAKKLQRDDLTGAERDFTHALALDPGNHNYLVAIAVAREHRLTELVHEATTARQQGNGSRADSLLAEARAIDPEDPIVLEHGGAAALQTSRSSQSTSPSPMRIAIAADATANPLTDRTSLLSNGDIHEPWRIAAPVVAGPIKLHPGEGTESFHLRGDSQQVLRSVTNAFGIRPVFDSSMPHKIVSLDLEDQPYDRVMAILMQMADVFAVPIDAKTILLARNDSVDRQRLERQLEETIYLPGMTVEQINDLVNVVRTVFDVKQATVQSTLESIVVRAPEEVLGPLNRTLADLIDGSGEVMIEVKLYEVSTTRTRNIGATIPQQFTTFNVDAEATNIVNANQALVQQAIAQGYITASTPNVEIAIALIKLGLVQSNLLTNLVGVVGGGLFRTGIDGSTNATFKFALNSSDSRALDEVQLRVSDRQATTFRAGSRYPITTSTYSTGPTTTNSALSNASINGVSVASLLSQYTGGSGATIPQISYEDLGVTLKATPIIQKSGRVNLLLDLKVEALAGGSANGIPVLGNRQVASDITVGDGESVLLVSNMTRSESAAITGLPGLSELPGFQAPLDRDAEKNAGQLVVMVTPHVVRRRSNVAAGPRILMGPEGAANIN